MRLIAVLIGLFLLSVAFPARSAKNTPDEYDPAELAAEDNAAMGNVLTFTPEEKKWLAAHSLIRLGVHQSYLPYEEVTSRNIYEGIVADYIRYICRRTGLKMKPDSLLSWYNPVKLVIDRKIDVIPMIGETREREKHILFSKPYLRLKIAIMTLNSKSLETVEELQGKTVAAILNHNYEKMLKQDYPGVNFFLVPNEIEAIKALAKGKVEAVIGDLATLTYLRRKTDSEPLKLIGITPYEYEICFGVREDWPELVSILNKTIQSMPTRQKHYLYRHWTSVRIEHEPDLTMVYRLAGLAGLVLLAIGVGVFLWRRRVIREISSRERSEDDLRSHLDFLQTLFDTIPGPVFCCNPYGTLLNCNRAFYDLLIGSTKENMIGNSLYEVIKVNNNDKVELFREKIQSAPGCSGAMLFDLEINAADSAVRDFSCYIASYRKNNQQVGVIAVMLDISEKKRIQRELELSKNAAEAATEAKGNFVANMSHELRTPLNAVIGISHLIRQTELNEKQVGYMEKIDSSSRHLLGVINDILDFSKIEAGKMTMENIDFNLFSICQELNDMFSAKAKEKQLSLIFKIDDKIPQTLCGDPLRLKQVLINLISNSIKFTESGSITITVETGRKRGRRIKIKFAVSDTGIGISPEQMRGLFEPFSQADNSMTRKFGGTGLGLVITKRLIEMMGGHLEIDSTQNVGSDFAFDAELDLGAEETSQANGGNSSVINVDRLTMKERNLERLEKIRGARVLLVEDNTINRQVAMEMLNHAGIVVESVENGKEAVDEIVGRGERFDAVFMDVQMPIMDGYKATEIIRAALIDVPIIALTAHVMPAAIKRCIQAGMNDHLNKPLNPELLYSSLLKWIKPGKRNAAPAGRKPVSIDDKPKLCDMPGLNISRALEPLDGDTVLLSQLLDTFRKDFGAEGNNIIRAYETGEFNYLKHSFHKLKGSAAYIGAEEIRTSAGALEEKIINNKEITMADAENLVRSLSQAIDSIAMLIGKPTVAH